MVFQTKEEPTPASFITQTKFLTNNGDLGQKPDFFAEKNALLAAKYLHGEVEWAKMVNGHFFLCGMGFPLVSSFWKNSTPSQSYEPRKTPFFQGGK